jgi:selenocysteine lyase/cysteine desulfurase
VHLLQERFLEGLAKAQFESLPAASLVPPRGQPRGNFLAFEVAGAEYVHQRLEAAGIYIDRRDRRLRFGFGVYHEPGDVDRLLGMMAGALG